MHLRCTFRIAVAAAALVCLGGLATLAADESGISGGTGPGYFAPSAVRNVSFTYSVEIAPNASGQHIEVWIPLPRNDAFQRIGSLSIESAMPHEVVSLGRYGNELVHLAAHAPLIGMRAKIKFEATRREQMADFSQAEKPQPEPLNGPFLPYLRPERLVPIDGKIAQVSSTLAAYQAPPLEQARAIYDYVTSVMKFDKSGEGWGRGDALYACEARRGNCTDFHALFIALARARGIPARFVIGFPLGNPGAGEIPAYHCWAEFYAGWVWVPVDASEAWKKPARHNYYFGRLDADRIAFTMGRDLVLNPPQRGEPLNFFVYPYAEIDGVPVDPNAIQRKLEYRDLILPDSNG